MDIILAYDKVIQIEKSKYVAIKLNADSHKNTNELPMKVRRTVGSKTKVYLQIFLYYIITNKYLISENFLIRFLMGSLVTFASGRPF